MTAFLAIDALLPGEIAEKAEAVGAEKARLNAVSLFVLAILAGAFIALGGMFATTAVAGADDLPWGLSRLLAGLVFSLGLILVIVASAELFTGNMLTVMAWAAAKIRLIEMLRDRHVGGGVLVGSVYWFVYLRKRGPPSGPSRAS